MRYFTSLVPEFQKAFLNKDPEETKRLFQDILGRITFHQRVKSERDCHVIFQSIFHIIACFSIRSETSGSKGRSDLVYIFPDGLQVIIEIKYLKKIATSDWSTIEQTLEESLTAALDQSEEKNYSGPYRTEAREIIQLALVVYSLDQVAVRYM
jgi:hypothetical protein